MPKQKIDLSLFYFHYRNSYRKWSQVLESMKINLWYFFHAWKIWKNVSWGPNHHGYEYIKVFMCENEHNWYSENYFLHLIFFSIFILWHENLPVRLKRCRSEFLIWDLIWDGWIDRLVSMKVYGKTQLLR